MVRYWWSILQHTLLFAGLTIKFSRFRKIGKEGDMKLKIGTHV
jgi:hypothetical protein